MTPIHLPFTKILVLLPNCSGEHSNIINRRLHYIGTTIVMIIILTSIITCNSKNLFYLPFVGYGFAWVNYLYL